VRDRLAPRKIARLALRMLARDWRAGELTVLAAALVLAVGSMGTVGFFADRVKSALTSEASLLLGADVMISSDRPLPASFADTATTSDHGVAALQQAADVAVKAAEDTKPMIAKRGRAAYTGERSIGSVDAGATAIGVIFQAVSAAWREKYGNQED